MYIVSLEIMIGQNIGHVSSHILTRGTTWNENRSS